MQRPQFTLTLPLGNNLRFHAMKYVDEPGVLCADCLIQSRGWPTTSHVSTTQHIAGGSVYVN